MVLQIQHVTIEEFDQFISLPENTDNSFEYIGGRIVEGVSSVRSSQIAMFIGSFVNVFVITKQLGYVTGADGGYIVSGERYIPDVGFISKARQSEVPNEVYNPLAPDLAVEVLSPSNEPGDMRIKIINYLRANTTVWLVDPDKKQVEVYVPDKAPVTLGEKDTLEGGDILPGFTLKVADIFALME